jgi:hypothetical protein
VAARVWGTFKSKMKLFDTSFGKFLIVLAVFAVGIYWLPAIEAVKALTSGGTWSRRTGGCPGTRCPCPVRP